MQVRMNIVRFCGRAVIDIAPDVAVELLFFQLCNRDQFAIFVERPSVPIDVCYLLDIFGAQGVLNLALFVFVVSIDKEYLLAGSGTGPVDNQNGGGNAGAVKKSLIVFCKPGSAFFCYSVLLQAASWFIRNGHFNQSC